MQKETIRSRDTGGRGGITAAQMLESMSFAGADPRGRTDVANAVIDGTWQ